MAGKHHRVRYAARLITAVSAVLISVAGIAAAGAAAPRTTVTVRLSTNIAKAGSHVSVTGTAKPAVSGRKIVLQRASGSTWIAAASGTTSGTGAYRLTLTAPGPGIWTYRVTTTVTGSSRTVASGSVRLTVASSITAALSAASATPGSRPAVAGTVKPAVSGRKVVLQRASGSKWITAASGTTSGTGTYRLTFTAPAIGIWRYRVVASATSHSVSAVSRSVSLSVSVPNMSGGYGLSTMGSTDKLYAVPVTGQSGGNRVLYTGHALESGGADISDNGVFAAVDISDAGVSSLIVGKAGTPAKVVKVAPAEACFGGAVVSFDGRVVLYGIGEKVTDQGGIKVCDKPTSFGIYDRQTGTASVPELTAPSGSVAHFGFWPGTTWIEWITYAPYKHLQLLDPWSGALYTPDFGCGGACFTEENLPAPAGALAALLSNPTVDNPSGQVLVHLDGTAPVPNTAVVLTSPVKMIASTGHKHATWKAPAAGAAASSAPHVWVGSVTGADAQDLGTPAGSAGSDPQSWIGDAFVISQTAAPSFDPLVVTPVPGVTGEQIPFAYGVQGFWL